MEQKFRTHESAPEPWGLLRWEAELVRRPALLLLVYAVLLAIPTGLFQKLSAHSTSRLATIESLVRDGTFAIDSSTYLDTIDKVKIGTHFYSHQPPLHPLLASLVYAPLYHLGLRFTPGKNFAVAILTFLTNGLATILGLILLFKALAWWDISRRLRLWITIFTGCATLLLPYSTTLNVHGVVAAFLFLGFYLLVRSGSEEHSNRFVFVAGLAFSLCAAMDHAMAAFYAAFCMDLFLRPERRKQVMWFLLPACLTVLPTLAYYFAISGSIKPVAARPELFNYPGSVWLTGKETLTGGHLNSVGFALKYAVQCLFGSSGFLIYNPALLLAIYGMGWTIRHKLKFWREAVAILAASLLMLTYYSFNSTNFGGYAYGLRWFVAILFVFCFYAGAVADQLARRKWLTFTLVAISLIYAAGGIFFPWAKLGYLGPVARINGRRAPLHTLSLTFSPSVVHRGSDGKWSFDLTLAETGGDHLDLTGFGIVGFTEQPDMWGTLGTMTLEPYQHVTAHLSLDHTPTPTSDIARIGVGGTRWTGREVMVLTDVTLLP